MNDTSCKNCGHKHAQFMCCLCEYRNECRCSKIEPPEEEDDD